MIELCQLWSLFISLFFVESFIIFILYGSWEFKAYQIIYESIFLNKRCSFTWLQLFWFVLFII